MDIAQEFGGLLHPDYPLFAIEVASASEVSYTALIVVMGLGEFQALCYFDYRGIDSSARSATLKHSYAMIGKR